jgi:hypothetical protein
MLVVAVQFQGQHPLRDRARKIGEGILIIRCAAETYATSSLQQQQQRVHQLQQQQLVVECMMD